MNTQEQDRHGTKLRAILAAAYPSDEPSDALQRRIGLEARQYEERVVRRTRRRTAIRLALTYTGAAALTLLTVAGWPTLVAAQTLHRMEAAVAGTQQMHSITWGISPNGTHEKLRELWADDGHARLETPGSVVVFAHKTLYSYALEAKRVTVKPQKRNPFFAFSDLSIGAMVRSVLSSGHPERIRPLDDFAINGKRVKRVAINLDGGSTTTGERAVLYAEAQSDLPICCDNQRLTRRGWLTEQTIEVHYNEAPASGLFTPVYPKDVQVIDQATERSLWRQMSGREIGRVQSADGTVVIHDLQVNAKGDVFLLTSGGDFGGSDVVYITHKNGTRTAITRAPPLDLTDDQGTRYLRQSNFGGQPDVQRWTPLTPTPGLWSARRLTVTFRSGRSYAASSRPNPLMTWTHHVVRPQSAVLPDYLPNVNPSLYWNETRILADDAVSRAEALRISSRQEDLERALVEYRNVIRIEDDGARQSGGTAVHPEAWFGISGVLRDLGRPGEARQALREAQDQDVYHNMTRQITEAWQRIGQGG